MSSKQYRKLDYEAFIYNDVSFYLGLCDLDRQDSVGAKCSDVIVIELV